MPVTVTLVPPFVVPAAGLMAVTVGAAIGFSARLSPGQEPASIVAYVGKVTLPAVGIGLLARSTAW